MNGLKKPHNEIEAYKVLEVDDEVHFADVLITQLMGPMQKQLLMDIQSWNVARIVESKRLTEFTFKEVIGRCTFDRLFIKRSRGKYILVVPYHTERHAENLVAHTYDGPLEFEEVGIRILEQSTSDEQLLDYLYDMQMRNIATKINSLRPMSIHTSTSTSTHPI